MSRTTQLDARRTISGAQRVGLSLSLSLSGGPLARQRETATNAPALERLMASLGGSFLAAPWPLAAGGPIRQRSTMSTR